MLVQKTALWSHREVGGEEITQKLSTLGLSLYFPFPYSRGKIQVSLLYTEHIFR